MQLVESVVTAVTVYRRGAVVVREAQLRSSDGRFPAQVQCAGLPLTLEDGSLQVEVVAVAESGPLPVARDVRVTLAVPPHDASLPAPEDDELEAGRLAAASAQRTLDDLVAAHARVDALVLTSRGEPEEGHAPQPSPTAARVQLLALRRSRAEALQVRIAAARVAVHASREHLQTLQERWRRSSDHRNARSFEVRKAAVVGLETGDGGPASVILRMRYFVHGARWAPAYTLRLERDLRQGSLEVRAVVGQATGEDWRNVALTLSTASPQQWTELAELKVLRIGRAQPTPRTTGWRPAPVGAEALYADFDRGLGPKPTPAPPPPPPRPAARLRQREEMEVAAAEPSPQEAPTISRSAVFAAPPPPQAPVARGGPPPAPAAAPAPMQLSAPMPRLEAAAARKSGGIGALIGGMADGVASAFGGNGGGGRADEAPPADGPAADLGMVVGRDLLDYVRLSVAGPESPQRGVLRRVETRTLYRELVRERVELDVAFAGIGRAQAVAAQLEARQAPAGHCWPETEGGFDYVYVADAPVDIDSVPKHTSIAILSRPSEATQRFISVPRESQDVFRIVALRNPLDAPLLPGPADVYVAGKFALTSDVTLTPAGGRIELGLGVEQNIKIARNVEYGEDTAGLLKRHQELSHRIDVDITNHLPYAALVEVRERVPVPGTQKAEEVEVVVESVSPAWEDYEPPRGAPEEGLEGGKVWKVDVPAGGERALCAHWVVKIPSQHELVGGNRRES